MTEQWRLPLLLCAAISLTFATIVALAHRLPTIASHSDQEVAYQRAINGSFLYDGGYVDDADYVLLGQIPYDTHAQGGVYFIGDSQSRTGLMTWRLRPEEQRLIHNYSLGDMRHKEQRAFVRMLVEEFGLLNGGAENTTIILGASYYMGRSKDYDDPISYLHQAVERHGFYGYGGGGFFRRLPLSAFERFIRVQRDCAHRFLTIAFSMRRSRVKPHSPDQQTQASRVLPHDWRPSMNSEVQEFAALLDYLLEREVRVRVLIRPSGSWENGLPYEREYRALLDPLLAARNVPLIDQSDLLSDSLLNDGEHTNYEGQQILHRADRDIALRELAEMSISVSGD